MDSERGGKRSRSIPHGKGKIKKKKNCCYGLSLPTKEPLASLANETVTHECARGSLLSERDPFVD